MSDIEEVEETREEKFAAFLRAWALEYKDDTLAAFACFDPEMVFSGEGMSISKILKVFLMFKNKAEAIVNE